MTSHHETLLVLSRLAELHAAGRSCALATVINVRGSAYRREGAKLVVAEDGSYQGNVSGGCLELDVREVALRVIRTGVAERRRYCSGADDIGAWDLGVGCEGEVEVLIEPAGDDWKSARQALSGELAFAICTPLTPLPSGRIIISEEHAVGRSDNRALTSEIWERGQALLVEGESQLVRIGTTECFIDVIHPTPQLLIVGAGDDARPLAQLALTIGMRVTVIDRRPGLLTPERFPGVARLVDADGATLSGSINIDANTMAVVMTHNFADDHDYLRALLLSTVTYIGVLGPRQRTDRMLALMGAVSDERVHGPVGLDIGAEGAEGVAIAIMAEIFAVRRGRNGGPLRERVHAIHG